MRSLVVSTVVYFAATFLLRRRLDDMGMPKGMTRSVLIFCVALVAAYGAAAALDWVLGTA